MSLVVWISPLPMHDNNHEFPRPVHTSPPYSPQSPTPVPMVTSSQSADLMARVDFGAMQIESSAESKQSSHILSYSLIFSHILSYSLIFSHILSFPMSGKILLMFLTMSQTLSEIERAKL
jgi:hypothetical protein